MNDNNHRRMSTHLYVSSNVFCLQKQHEVSCFFFYKVKNNTDTSDTPLTETITTRIRKRSHSNSDSEKPEKTNDISKKSK